jgi:chromate transporter
VQNGWLTAAELADVAAISQMTPGPIAINCATYVGFEVTGNVWGSLLATIAVCLPSLTLMMLATHFYLRLRGNKHFEGTIAGMMPMMIGLILSSALMLFGVETFIDWKSWVIFLGCFVASVRKVNPIVLILLSAVVGIIIYI